VAGSQGNFSQYALNRANAGLVNVPGSGVPGAPPLGYTMGANGMPASFSLSDLSKLIPNAGWSPGAFGIPGSATTPGSTYGGIFGGMPNESAMYDPNNPQAGIAIGTGVSTAPGDTGGTRQYYNYNPATGQFVNDPSKAYGYGATPDSGGFETAFPFAAFAGLAGAGASGLLGSDAASGASPLTQAAAAPTDPGILDPTGNFISPTAPQIDPNMAGPLSIGAGSGGAGGGLSTLGTIQKIGQGAGAVNSLTGGRNPVLGALGAAGSMAGGIGGLESPSILNQIVGGLGLAAGTAGLINALGGSGAPNSITGAPAPSSNTGTPPVTTGNLPFSTSATQAQAAPSQPMTPLPQTVTGSYGGPSMNTGLNNWGNYFIPQRMQFQNTGNRPLTPSFNYSGGAPMNTGVGSMGPSSAINLNDPSASLFGYGGMGSQAQPASPLTQMSGAPAGAATPPATGPVARNMGPMMRPGMGAMTQMPSMGPGPGQAPGTMPMRTMGPVQNPGMPPQPTSPLQMYAGGGSTWGSGYAGGGPVEEPPVNYSSNEPGHSETWSTVGNWVHHDDLMHRPVSHSFEVPPHVLDAMVNHAHGDSRIGLADGVPHLSHGGEVFNIAGNRPAFHDVPSQRAISTSFHVPPDDGLAMLRHGNPDPSVMGHDIPHLAGGGSMLNINAMPGMMKEHITNFGNQHPPGSMEQLFRKARAAHFDDGGSVDISQYTQDPNAMFNQSYTQDPNAALSQSLTGPTPYTSDTSSSSSSSNPVGDLTQMYNSLGAMGGGPSSAPTPPSSSDTLPPSGTTIGAGTHTTLPSEAAGSGGKGQGSFLKDLMSGNFSNMLSNPQSMAGALAALNLISSVGKRSGSAGQLTAQQLQNTLPATSAGTAWSPQNAILAASYFGTPHQPRQVSNPQSYNGRTGVPLFFKQAHGGESGSGPLGTVAHGLTHGSGGGQEDNIPSLLSPGEYVMDADTVSSLGDGNNSEGARKLDMMREAVRRHKRAAPASKIPPKAKEPHAYLAGGKKK